MASHNQFDSLMRQLEQELEAENSFDRLLQQEEEMESKTLTPGPHRPRSFPNGNPEIRWLQQALNRVSAFGIAEDGVLSVQTTRALQKFQAEQGIRPTGKLGLRTRSALIEASGMLAPRTSADEGSTPLGEVEVTSSRCPADNPNVITGFSRYSDDIRQLPRDQFAKLQKIFHQIDDSLSGSPGATPVPEVLIVGHADLDAARESREPGFTQYLSEKRALEAYFYLSCRLGEAKANRIRWQRQGRGARVLSVPAPQTEAQRKCNRRVEIVLGRSALLPHLDANQTGPASVDQTDFLDYYHIALQGTSGKWDKPYDAAHQARDIAEKASALVEQRAHRVRKKLGRGGTVSEISETSYCHPAGANPA